jgi:hypothetical protein
MSVHSQITNLTIIDTDILIGKQDYRFIQGLNLLTYP